VHEHRIAPAARERRGHVARSDEPDLHRVEYEGGRVGDACFTTG
jgi:hypothetical protein